FISSFFYWSVHPHDLHSFPTRRSSDLKPMNETWHIAIGRAFASSPETLSLGINNQVAIATDATGSQTKHIVVIVDEPSNAELTADRKSTRLNSSHRTISYAVFCLKKKK